MTQLASLFALRENAYSGPAAHRWDDMFGIELELENVRATSPAPSEDREDYDEDDDDNYDRERRSARALRVPGWDIHSDASLRNGREFVTAPAQGGRTLEQSIASFYAREFSYTAGPRTSTHIHVNMTRDTQATLQSIIVLVYMLEDGIYAAAEESRKWGGYSVPLSEMRPSRLRGILNPQNNRMFTQNVIPQRNNERYYGFNCNVAKHGTVEFRYFPGGPTRPELESWVDMVAFFKRAAKTFTVAELNTAMHNEESMVAFMRTHFGYWADKFLAVRTPEFYFNKLQDVLALAMDEENLERDSGIMYVTEGLLSYTNRTILENIPERIEYLSKAIPKNKLISAGDWQYILMEARQVIPLSVSSAPQPTARRPAATLADPYGDINTVAAYPNDWLIPPASPAARPTGQTIGMTSARDRERQRIAELVQRQREEMAAESDRIRMQRAAEVLRQANVGTPAAAATVTLHSLYGDTPPSFSYNPTRRTR